MRMFPMVKHITLAIIIAVFLSSCGEDKIVTPETKTYTVSGMVLNQDSQTGIEHAAVTIGAVTDSVAADGYFAFTDVEAGAQRLLIFHPDYVELDTIITVESDRSDTYYLSKPGFTIDGSVNIIWNGVLYPVENAKVTLQEYSTVNSECSVYTKADGLFRFENVKPRFRAFSVAHITDEYNNTFSTSTYFQADTTMVVTLKPLPEDYFPMKTGNEWVYEYSCFKTIRHPNVYEEKDGTLTWKVLSSDDGFDNRAYHCLSIFSGTLRNTDLENQIDDTISVEADTTYFDIIESDGQAYIEYDAFCTDLRDEQYFIFEKEYPYIFSSTLNTVSSIGELYDLSRETGILNYSYDNMANHRRTVAMKLLSSHLNE